MSIEQLQFTTTTTTATVSIEEEEQETLQTIPLIPDHKRKLEDQEKEVNEELLDEAGGISEAKRARLVAVDTIQEEERKESENGHGGMKEIDVLMPLENVENMYVTVESVKEESIEILVVESQNMEGIQESVREVPNEDAKFEGIDGENVIEEDRKVEDGMRNSELEGDAQKKEDSVVENEKLQAEGITSLGGEIGEKHDVLEIPEHGDFSLVKHQVDQQADWKGQKLSRKMEVPNNKVGVLIGKAGETIRLLQSNSGARIQITKDAEADSNSSTRQVELIGNLENVNKAERLIKDVIAEADAGGSPSLVARGFGTAQASGSAEQFQLQVPNEKVGVIIGRGGETIKSMQSKSGARIQLIPQHLPEGDESKERIVKVTGDRRQIEVAKEMINEVMNQNVRSSTGGAHHGSRGCYGASQWSSGNRAGYNYQQGNYSSQHNPHYPSRAYGGHPQQSSQPNNFNTGRDQRSSSGPHRMQMLSQGGYYGQSGGHAPVYNAHAAVAPNQANYNNYPVQGAQYEQQPSSYQQLAPTQQNYGQQGYNNQIQTTHSPAYNGVTAQPGGGGVYPQQQYTSNQPGNPQQTYAMPPNAYQGPPSQLYGLQGQILSNPSHAPPQQQSYPAYGVPGGSTQQSYPPYGSSASSGVANAGYSQPQQQYAAGVAYPQQSVVGYVQQGNIPMYLQSGQSYGQQYPPAQQPAVYAVQQPGATNAGAGYSNAPAAAYLTPPQNAQAIYVQPAPSQPNYEHQQVIQSSVQESAPGNANATQVHVAQKQ